MITVRELIQILESQDPDLIVELEGCDCTELASGEVRLSETTEPINGEPAVLWTLLILRR